ncbi:PREDICTED: vicilin-like seed storage protein At2g18540 [Dufourea novaeangliae]|nr:PREDICTED: vicilin-like seed storage protein At2g18540 [Dufourea novaeangliae]
MDQAQHGDDARMEEMRQRTEELQRQQEAQRLALVAAKKTQQYLSQCPDIRERVVKQYTVEVKEGNLIQMAENEAKRQADEEVERLWHNLMLKDVEAKKEREVEEAKKRSLQDRDMVTTLEKQIAGRLLLEEQKKQVQKEDKEYVECLIEEMRKDEVQRAENIRIKRQVLKRDLQEQVLNAKRRLAEQACREREIDRLRDNLVADEIAKERRKMKESSTVLRNELLAYLRYLEDLRKEEARRNLAVDRIVEESMKKANARRDLAVKRFKEARQRGLQEVLRSREEQMRLKCQMDREEEERRRLEKEEVEKEIEMEAKLAARAKEEAKDRKLRYKQYLEEQQKHADEARRRETEEEERWHQEEVKRREESLKLTNELLMASENIIPHPFKALLKQCIARYEAEKNNQCDCLYPLSLE